MSHAEIARAEEREILTLDVGFADVRAYPPRPRYPSRMNAVLRPYMERASKLVSNSANRRGIAK